MPSRNESFRAIVNGKAPEELVAIASQHDAGQLAARFGEWLKQQLSSAKAYRAEPTEIVFFGKTVNNRNEFNFFIKLLEEHQVRASVRFFLEDFSTTIVSMKSIEQIHSKVIEDALRFCSQGAMSPAELWYLYQYCAAYLSIRASYDTCKEALPVLGVVANDHSPSQVAFKAALEGYGVPMVYVQHAQVSKSFPPLDFYLSILRNDASLEAYREAGDVVGEIVVASRYPNSKIKSVPAVLAELSGRVSVGIYPTSQFDAKSLNSVAEELASNPSVADVFVKLHPNNKTTLNGSQRGGLRMVSAPPKHPHIAVVGNSSVALDLLAAGAPVFHVFALDTVEPDYYRFVSDGITQSITVEDLAGYEFRNDTFYNIGWLGRISRFEPSVVDSQLLVRRRVAQLVLEKLAAGRLSAMYPSGSSVAQRSAMRSSLVRNFVRVLRWGAAPLRRRFPRQINRLISVVTPFARSAMGGGTRRHSADKPIINTMNRARDPLLLANAILLSSDTKDAFLGVKAWFDSHWVQRDQRAFHFVRAAAERISDPLHVWLRLLAHDLMALPVSSEAAGPLVEQIRAVESLTIRKHCEDLGLRILVRNKQGQHFLSLLMNSPLRQLSLLSGNMKVEVARLLTSPEYDLPQRERENFFKSLTPFERAKLVANGVPLEGVKSQHRELEKQFVALTKGTIAKRFLELAAPAYEKLRPQMQFMDVRTDLSQRNELKLLIREALLHRRPFSLVRLGDGEAYLFDSSVLFKYEDRLLRERHWWNLQLTEEDRVTVKTTAIAAIVAADVVGIPSIHRFFRDYSDQSVDLLSTVANRGVVGCLVGAASILPASVPLTEDRVHHIIFEREGLRELMELAGRTVVVSSVREEVILNALQGYSERVEAIAVPTHARTLGNGMFVSREEPLPLVAPQIEQHLHDLVRPGDLVLVSAGVAGKRFVGLAKDRGAVALDVGGQIEPLAGIPSGAIF